MVQFSWNSWLGALNRVAGRGVRKPRRARTARIEVLEERALLTANLPVAVNDTYSVVSDNALNGTTVLENDTDADGDTIDQAVISANPISGNLVLNTDGTFVYTPNAGFVGTDSFTYFAVDSLNAETSAAPATVTINVVPEANETPVANPVTLSTAVDTVLNGTLTASDADGNPLTFSAGGTLATNGNVVINTDGTFSYTPNVGFNGTDTFSFKVNDGTIDSADALVTVNVGSVANVAPVGTPATLSTNLDTALNGTLTATDADGDPLTFAAGATAATNGTVVVNPDGTFTFTPTAGFSGTGSFTFTANDGTLTSPETTVTVQIGIANSLPVVVPVTLSTDIDTALNGTLVATDANNDPLTFSAGAAAATNGTVVINPDGTFTFTPTAGFTGAATFSYRASDGLGDSNDATVTVNVAAAANVAPVGVPATVSTPVDTVLNGTLTATDADGDPLTFAVGATAATNGTVVVNPNGTFTFTPTAGFTGSGSFTFTANDGSLTSAETTVTVQIGVTNTLPVVLPATISTTTDTAVNGTLLATDADNDPVTFSAGATAATNGTVVINPDGTFTFTPTAGFTGVGTFSYRANDGTGNSNDATVTVNIDAIANVAPIGAPATVSTPVNTALNGVLNATDANGDPLTFAEGTIAATNGTVVINPNGTFTFTPTVGFSGSGSFSFRASDGILSSTDTIVTVQVGITNTLPVVAPVTLSTNLNTTLNGTLVGTDADNDPLTFSAGSTAATNGTVVINPNGTFTFTPTAGFTGVATFSYKANDGLGDSADSTVTVNVGAAINLPPVATPVTINPVINTAFNGTLTGTDANGDPLTFSAGTTAAANGTVVINADGTFTYTPAAGFTGTDFFSFKVNDGQADSTEALVTAVVSAVANTAPTIINGTATVNAGATFNGTLTPLANDAEGNALTFAAVTQPANGTLSLSPDGTFTYTPNVGFTGTDTFTFKANDSLLDSNIGTLTITVVDSIELFDLDLAATGTIATKKKLVTPLDATASLSAIDPAADFSGATIIARITDGGDSRKDKLFVIKNRSSAVQVRGKRILINGSEVASISGGRRGQQLQISFNSSATADSVNAVMQRIGARTTRNSVSTTRTVEIQVSADGTVASDTIAATKVS